MKANLGVLAWFNRVASSLGSSRLGVDISSGTDGWVVRSNGLRNAGLPEVEISDCPERLKEVASNLVLQIALNGKKDPASLAEGKTIGGRFANPDQPLIEGFRLVRANTDSSVLRVMDLTGVDTTFPRHLVATHLCSTAGTSRRDALRLLLVSIEVWPKERVSSNAALGDFEFNPNNFWSWVDLGTTLAHSKQKDEAIAHWKTAVCMWPRGGKLYATKMLARDSSKTTWAGTDRSEQDFWQSVTNDAIRSWCTELGVELPEETLA